MLYSEKMNICSGIQEIHTDVLRGLNVELLSVKPDEL